MTDHVVELAKIDWKRTFPWVRLFRVFRTAIDLRMVLLGSLALVALAAGDWLFSYLPFAPDGNLESPHRWDTPALSVSPLDLPKAAIENRWGQFLGLGSDWGIVLRPVRTVMVPALTLLRAGGSWSEKGFAWTQVLWALCVWAVAAGAMTRIAALEQAGTSRISLAGAVRFSLQNFVSYMTAAILPAVGIGLFWLFCLVGGLIGRVPYVGPPVLGLFWGLELVFGLVMTLILIGAAAGWPLMYATISTEASDGFDGFSRAYSYIFSRPWHALWFALVAILYGTIVVGFVWFVASLVVYLAAAGVSSGLGLGATASLLQHSPKAIGGPELLGAVPTAEGGIASVFAGAWLQLVWLLVSGFAASYFWSAATVIYLLLREVDDATDFHEVYVPPEKEVDDLLPLVGVAASDHPVVERPPEGDFAATPTADGRKGERMKQED